MCKSINTSVRPSVCLSVRQAKGETRFSRPWIKLEVWFILCRFLSYMSIYSINISYVCLSELRYLWMLSSLLIYWLKLYYNLDEPTTHSTNHQWRRINTLGEVSFVGAFTYFNFWPMTPPPHINIFINTLNKEGVGVYPIYRPNWLL